jgi:hypothetical protein
MQNISHERGVVDLGGKGLHHGPERREEEAEREREASGRE